MNVVYGQGTVIPTRRQINPAAQAYETAAVFLNVSTMKIPAVYQTTSYLAGIEALYVTETTSSLSTITTNSYRTLLSY